MKSAIAIVFGLLYAYILWAAIGNLVEVPKALPAGRVPWWLLIVDVALPVVVYTVALVLGRRRGVWERGILFLVGLTVLASVTVASIAYVQTH